MVHVAVHGSFAVGVPGLFQQLQAKAGQGPVDLLAVGGGYGQFGGGELLAGGGLGAAGQQAEAQGAGQEKGKGSFHKNSSYFVVLPI